ncbi:spindle pole body formation-associated protein-domain-containing protein [Podospora didyma]|uniref:Spindle pole body formation-associated protein-domain-containing protein n=1 Tax=Podospora didyma TaxID=330526 RepID=A0AAE0NCN7_9PEZI|nr:spindle pole body formation-associated protein-domain-containing protein [Podospora didyma]
MINWALKRSKSDSAQDAPEADDTHLDLPDTPAPVFAVRALKTVLFGTPAARHPKPRALTKGKDTHHGVNPTSLGDKSPIRPAGILLTPGTATARRKRVSFGSDVKEGSAVQGTSTTGLPEECPGKFPSPWTDHGADLDSSRPKTRLTQAMERSRSSNKKGATAEPDDGWEEVDDESDYEPDVTVDLNEPHSRSGKYWKSYFESYHADAKAEMEKLVKYKQLAKSYAKKKDEEAINLNEKLKEEQERLKLMESKIAEMSNQVRQNAKLGGDEYDSRLVDELNKQTALALEYKKQVEELESLLGDGNEETGEKGSRQRRIASPRTQKTLMETQRELRRARAQAKELEKLREERDKLRSELKFAEQRATKLVEENKRLSGDLTHQASKVQNLERRLEETKKSYDKIKEDAKSRYSEAQAVIQKKTEKLSELQAEIGTLRRERAAESRWATRAKSLEAKLKSGSEGIEAPDQATALKFLATAEEESTQLLKELQELRQVSIQKGLLAPSGSLGTKERTRRSLEPYNYDTRDDEALISARTLREKIDADMGKRLSSTVLGDRANLQDSLSSASSGARAHNSTHSSQELALHRTSRADRLSRAKSTSAMAATTNSRGKASIDDILGESRSSKTSREPAAVSVEQQSAKPSARAVQSLGTESPHIDLVQDNFARLGGPDVHASAMWDVSATKTTLPSGRHNAALARLEQKRAQRAAEQMARAQPDRNKENMIPY